MESLKDKFGVEAFSTAIQSVRDGVRNRRMARMTKRKIEAVAMPERHGEQKRKKGERKRERRKEKGQEHSQRRKELM
jgi:U3 small nucleolar RNA-associated protein 20